MNRFLILIILSIFLFGCSKYDDDALWSNVNDLDSRVSQLETTLQSLNADISSIQSLVVALQNRDYITAVTQLPDKSGYTIAFSQGNSVWVEGYLKIVNQSVSV